MRKIGTSEIRSYFDESTGIRKATIDEIRKGPGHKVHNYVELDRKVAELQFRNPEHVLLFRGQDNYYQFVSPKKGPRYSSLKPSLFRPKSDAGIAGESLLGSRFAVLNNAESLLVERYSDGPSLPGVEKLRRHRVLRWAI